MILMISPLKLTIIFPLLLLFIRNPSGFCLTLLHFPQVDPNCAAPERVRLRRATVFLVGCPEPADERVEAAPRLPERAGARGGRGGLPEKDAAVQVHLGFSELIQIPEEIEDVVEVALRHGDWRRLVF